MKYNIELAHASITFADKKSFTSLKKKEDITATTSCCESDSDSYKRAKFAYKS